MGFKKLNPISHFLFCANDINLLGRNINIVNKDGEFLFPTSKGTGLEVNDERTITRSWLVIRM